ALIAPARYVQGPGVLDDLGRYVSPLRVSRAALLLSPGGSTRFGGRIRKGLARTGVDALEVAFGGESSAAEVERIVGLLEGEAGIDHVITVGGGKCIDTGKMVAHRLGVPVVVCPSLASTDAPCSALSVVYSPDGVVESLAFFPDSPALVAIDTAVVAAAPLRYLVAGMGDALATWYEARACLANPEARSVLGARPTITAAAIGELCARTLYDHGEAAVAAITEPAVTEDLERVVEANTLLSGVGFESGGIAAAHCVASGLTAIERVRSNYLHGEMVAIGLLTQLVLEGDAEEARRAAVFCATVGLPFRLEHVALSASDQAALSTVAEAAMAIDFIHNEPVAVDAARLAAAMRDADALGATVAGEHGEAAYGVLHGAAPRPA
ncbi:MAG TPA: glycerol dehydrogenase, partial [Longimicrobiales bacterium]|nr:glycerol dehydrogenase [Longimicrobiales bacterium]